jgi:hypothetical protein
MGLENQSKTPGRTTLLEAVNVCLENIGEAPINSLETQQVTEARIAERTLLEFHKEGQSQGWCWNTEASYLFTKDSSSQEIVVPANVVRWSPDPYTWAGRFQLRGQKVYDRVNRTTKLSTEITELEADVVFLLSWDDCPEPFNRWVTIRSARVFSDRVLSSDSIFKYTAKDEMDALVELKRMESENTRANVLSGGPGLSPFPTYSPGTGLIRRLIGGGVRVG